MSRPIPPSYKTKNWPAYNEALKQRGSLTIWFDPDMVWVPPPTGKRGRQPQYSDAAIQTCLTMKVLFGMALRQTTGFVESLLRLVGLDWAVPDFSTLSRRQKALAVTIPYRGSQGLFRKQQRHLEPRAPAVRTVFGGLRVVTRAEAELDRLFVYLDHLRDGEVDRHRPFAGFPVVGRIRC